MLEHCAPGHTCRATKHHYHVTWNGRTYPALPLGEHGKREAADLPTGHVRSMVRFLGIDRSCAASRLPMMAKSFRDDHD